MHISDCKYILHKTSACLCNSSHWKIILLHISTTSLQWSAVSLRPHKANFLFWSYKSLKWCTNSKMRCGGWGLGTRLQNAENCVSKEPRYRSLDGEATECRLCKNCGCMLNTDYIWLCKSSSSEKIDPHGDQKQEINFVWPKLLLRAGLIHALSMNWIFMQLWSVC